MSDLFGVASCRSNRRAVRSGFTLVELLVVIVIIAILASLFLGALSQAEQLAREGRARALVDKLHNMLMARWDAYKTVRLPITAESKSVSGQQALFDAGTELTRYRQNVARRRMFALRELLRMEMPDRYSDLDTSFSPVVLVQPQNDRVPIRPTLWNAYRGKILTAKNTNQSTKNMSMDDFIRRAAQQYESAECLYLIVTTGIDSADVSTVHISPEDWGDKDLDGMPEFHDPWGNPIEFLRWAPAFVSSMQPLYRYHNNDPRIKDKRIFHSAQPRDPDNPEYVLSRYNVTIDKAVLQTTLASAISTSTRQVGDRIIIVPQDDPFNPLRVGSTPDAVSNNNTWQRSTRWRPGDPPPENGYVLYPLVYSYGRDRSGGIQHCFEWHDGFEFADAPSDGWKDQTANIKFSDPYARYRDKNGVIWQRGQPTGDGTHYDNIHNQQIATN